MKIPVFKFRLYFYILVVYINDCDITYMYLLLINEMFETDCNISQPFHKKCYVFHYNFTSV